MRPRILRSSTEMRAKSAMKTPRTPEILIRLEATNCTHSGALERNERSHCFSERKIWSTEPLIPPRRKAISDCLGKSECAGTRSDSRLTKTQQLHYSSDCDA